MGPRPLRHRRRGGRKVPPAGRGASPSALPDTPVCTQRATALAEAAEEVFQQGLAVGFGAAMLGCDVLFERGGVALVEDAQVERVLAVGVVHGLDWVGWIVIGGHRRDALFVGLERV